MGISVLVGDKRNVDFASPIELDADKKEKFLNLLNSLFAVVDVSEVPAFRNWRIGEEGRIQYPHSWDDKEYHFLLSCHSIEEAVDKLGRSGMSVIIQSGFWVPKYYSWCKEKKKPGRGRDGQDVISHRPEKVLKHFSVNFPCQDNKSNQMLRITLGKDYIPRFDGDIGSGANRNTGVCLSQSRSIIYSAACFVSPVSIATFTPNLWSSFTA